MRSRLFVVLAAEFAAMACSSPPQGSGNVGVDAGPIGGTDAGAVGGADGGSADADAGTGIADGGSGTGGGGSVDGGGGSSGGGGSVDAGTPPTPAQLTAGGENALALAIDGTNIYWLRSGTYVTSMGDTFHLIDVRSMPKAGGAAVTLAHTNSIGTSTFLRPTGISVAADAVYWEASDCGPCDYPGAQKDWGIFSLAPGGYRSVAHLNGSGGLAATATTAFSRSSNPDTGRWNLLRCAGDGSGCSNLETDVPLAAPLYLDSGKLYDIEEPSDTDFGPRSLLCNWIVEPSYAANGCLTLSNVTGISGLRVDDQFFAVRARGSIWTGSLNDSRPLLQIWIASNGDDVDISQGRVYWTQNPDGTYPGCLGSANLDGTDGHCLDQGDHVYGPVKVDNTTVFFIRDGEIFRLSK